MEELSANQSAEPVVTETPAVTETATPAAETVTTPVTEPSGIKVKFNKEEHIVGLDEAPNWIQKGMNYDKVQERATQLEQQAKHLERVAKFYGYEKPDEYMAALDQAEQEALIQEQAAKLGVPEDFIRGELQPLKSELEALKAERTQLQQRESERQLASDVERVKAANPDFDQYFDAIVPLFQKGYSIEDAYRLASYEDKLSSLGQQKEQEVLARVTGRDDKQVLSSDDKPNNLAFNPSNMSEKEIMDISARVQRGERITFK